MTGLLAAHLFLMALGVGTLAWTLGTSLKSLGTGFHQLHTTIGVAALALSLMDRGRGIVALERALYRATDGQVPLMPEAFPTATIFVTLGLILLFVGVTILYSANAKLALRVHAAGAVVAVAWFCVELWHLGALMRWPSMPLASNAFMLITGLTSATVLGLSVLTMNLGHWYLVNPLLGIGHLGLPTLWLFMALIVRGALLGASVLVCLAPGLLGDRIGPTHVLAQAASRVAGETYSLGVVEVCRVIAGWLVPTVLCWMAAKTVEIRSTQSATGILYAVLVLVGVGEGLAAFLIATRLMPW